MFSRRVCKALREQAQRVPWTNLRLVDGERIRTRTTNETLWLAPGAFYNDQMSRFLRDSKLTRLALDLRLTPNDPKDIARLVSAVPSLTDLSLTDKKMLSPVMKALASLPHVRRLKRFALGHGASTKSDVVKLLSSMTQLEALRLDNGLPADALMDVFRAWRRARGGGALLLHSLTIGNRICAQLGPTLRVLRDACPELRELRFGAYFPDLPLPLSLPAELRTLHVDLHAFDNSRKPIEESDRFEYRNADTAQLVRDVLAASPPGLEEACIGWASPAHRPIDMMTKWELEVGNALEAVPRSLRTLTLRNMNVDGGGGGGAPVHGLALPTALRKLRLEGCGVNQCMVDAMEVAGVDVEGA